MTIQTTRWRPDTCKCIMEYQWDDTVPQDQRTHSVSKIVEACPIHTGQPDKETHYNIVKDENQSKNKAVGLLVKTFAKLDGGAEEIKWRFDENRNIILSHPALNAADKAIFTALNKSEIKKQVSIE